MYRKSIVHVHTRTCTEKYQYNGLLTFSKSRCNKLSVHNFNNCTHLISAYSLRI